MQEGGRLAPPRALTVPTRDGAVAQKPAKRSRRPCLGQQTGKRPWSVGLLVDGNAVSGVLGLVLVALELGVLATGARG